MSLLRRITDGVTDDNVYRRIGWMYVSFFALFMSVTVLSFYLLLEDALRGKYPVISELRLSSDLWISTPQVFGYNLIPTRSSLAASNV